ncbi:Chitin binding Peritrophin-A domain-containing protein [Chitinophaga jiangningensis]|uniref:Chitin binding Peritrophin-A domain-containing protein n=1 Tax=Chitinophaga jiangningensis TaxID=1419482 RepID=A0A1M7LJ39_9BACT|nr:chitin binding peritrophin-A domain-containing protein [Chitinophaga jiangningensis]SHM78163.1 Chitin binding Peritrophin-A domain-containing protein [Chitinophaga jiangningensis]
MKKKIAMFVAGIAFIASAAIAQVPFNPDYCAQNHLAAGVYPHPSSYPNFYVCTEEGYTLLGQCPAGLWFNPTLKVCDWPWEVETGI